MLRKILVLCMIACMLLSLVGCSNNTSITVTEFEDYFEEKDDFEVVRIEDNEEGIDDLVSVSLEDDSDYSILFFDLVDNSTAYTLFENCREEAGEEVSASSYSSFGTKGTYSGSSSDTYYYFASRQDTFILVEVPKKYKDDVKVILEELGY